MIKYLPFKIEDWFQKLDLKIKKKNFNKRKDVSPIKTPEFSLPLINAKFGNNGIMFYGREADFESAEMCIDIVQNGAIATGKVYAQPQKTGVLWDAYLVKPLFPRLSVEILLYLTKCLEKSIQEKFDYDNKAIWDRVKKEYIMLPSSDGIIPDIDYMESRIRELEESRIRELSNYLKVSGLENYNLTEEEREILTQKARFKEFKICDLFSPITGDFDIQQSHLTSDGEYVISSGESNLGIIGKTNISAKILPPNTLTIDMFGNVYFRDFSYKMVTHARVFALKYKRKDLTTEEGLYLTTQLKYLKKQFSYNNMASWAKVSNLKLLMPIKNNDDIDYEYIKKYTKLYEKLAIKDVVDYKNLIINSTKQVVQN